MRQGPIQLVNHDIVLKTTVPRRSAAAVAVAPGFGHENRFPSSAGSYDAFAQGVRREASKSDRGTTKPMTTDASCRAPRSKSATNPSRAELASVVHQGSMETGADTDVVFATWTEDSGDRLAGRRRELYLASHDPDDVRNVAGLGMPVARWAANLQTDVNVTDAPGPTKRAARELPFELAVGPGRRAAAGRDGPEAIDLARGVGE